MTITDVLEDLDFEGWNRATEVGLIAASCGSGKTYASIHTLPRILGVDPEKTLLLVPRVTIREQILSDYADNAEGFTTFAAPGKVQVSTPHQIGQWFKDDSGMMPTPELVIVDEWHTVFYETDFAQQLPYFQQKFLEWCENPQVTIVSMTATTTLPMEFVNKAPFAGLGWIYDNVSRCKVRMLCNRLEPTYKVGKIFVQRGTSLKTVLAQNPATPQDKQLVLFRGKLEDMRKLAESEENASWLCSMSTSRIIDGVQACDLMNQEHYQSVIGGNFPTDVNRLYVTSGYREGINVHDASVRTVIIEGITDVDIVQTLGRIRHDIDRLIVVVDRKKFRSSNEKVEAAVNLLETGNFSAYLQRLEEQDRPDFEGEKVPNLVFKNPRTKEVTFNYLALCKWLYEQCATWSAAKADNEGISFAGTELPKSKPYFRGILGPYSDSPISFDSFSYKPSRESITRENARKVEEFAWEEWSGKSIIVGSEDEERFLAALNLKSKDGSTGYLKSMGTVKKRFPQYFGKNTRPRIDGKQYTAYNIL